MGGVRSAAAQRLWESLPPEDRSLSPLTGWGREHLEAAVDALVNDALRYASPSSSLINPPGRDNLRSSRWCDGLEGFARVGLFAGPRVAGAGGADPHHVLERWASGLAAGTDPSSPERWPTLAEHGQAKVEAAAVVLLLEQTRPWLWDRLDEDVCARVLTWLEGAVGSDYPPINWVWFRLVVEAFLAREGGRWSPDDVAADLALHASFAREGGWCSDGAGRDFDHYGGWALHLYPLLWTRQPGAAQLARAVGEDVDVLRGRWSSRLHEWLSDAALLVGSGAAAGDPDGAVPLLQGRSLTYRFAAAAPFWVGALEDCTPLAPGLTRRLGLGMVRHFLSGGSLTEDGTLSLGWQEEFLPIVQPYSGAASPYWAAKGALGLLLPAGHPVWTAPEEPLPVEVADTAAVAAAPGWLVAGTRTDGVVRVLNHGTDHAAEGSAGADDPLYARLGYSTATSPDLGAGPATDPTDAAVVVLDTAGRASHRAGFRTVEVRRDDDALVGVSQGRVHWHGDVDGDHGSSRAPGDPGPVLTTASVVRGALEVRLARVDGSDAFPGLRVRVGGWAVAEGQSLRSSVTPLRGLPEEGTSTRTGASPFGPTSTTPWLAGPVRDGEVVAALVVLTGDPSLDVAAAAAGTCVEVEDSGGGSVVTVTWPDGDRTRTTLPAV